MRGRASCKRNPEGSRSFFFAARSVNAIQTCLGVLWFPPWSESESIRAFSLIDALLCLPSLSGSFAAQSVSLAHRMQSLLSWDVMENYHLHRPRALKCPPAGSPISLQEEREGGGGGQKHKLRVNEVLEGGREGRC